jgi:hypothetical protein
VHFVIAAREIDRSGGAHGYMMRMREENAPGIQQYSEDLSFELYTIVPEPSTVILLLLGSSGVAMAHECENRIERGSPKLK